jgi:hypothetical protein
VNLETPVKVEDHKGDMQKPLTGEYKTGYQQYFDLVAERYPKGIEEPPYL